MKRKLLFCLILFVTLACVRPLEWNLGRARSEENIVGTWTEVKFSCEKKSYTECSRLVLNPDGTFAATNYSIDEQPLSLLIISEAEGTWELITEGEGVFRFQYLRISVEHYKGTPNTYHDVLYFNVSGQLYGGVDEIYVMYQKDD